MHSLFVSEDPFHILYRREGVVVNSRVILVTLNATESFVHGVEGLLAVLDEGQEHAIIEVRLNRLGVDRRLDLFLSFFFYQGQNLCIARL